MRRGPERRFLERRLAELSAVSERFEIGRAGCRFRAMPSDYSLCERDRRTGSPAAQGGRRRALHALMYGEEGALSAAETGEACYQKSVQLTHDLNEAGQFVATAPLSPPRPPPASGSARAGAW